MRAVTVEENAQATTHAGMLAHDKVYAEKREEISNRGAGEE